MALTDKGIIKFFSLNSIINRDTSNIMSPVKINEFGKFIIKY